MAIINKELEIHPLYEESGSICGFYAKGDFNGRQMATAIRLFDDPELHKDDEDWVDWSKFQYNEMMYISTRYYRWVPIPLALRDSALTRRLEPTQQGRGAFLATVLLL